jgi:hypothetical protein
MSENKYKHDPEILKPEALKSLYCSPDLYRQWTKKNWTFLSDGDG